MLPTFLIIGGMKCGTTTLYRDLLTQPGVFFPIDKEPEALSDPAVTTPAGRDAYARLFENARPTDARGEASTGYTKLPNNPGVAQRAREVLGPELKLIYLVREPVARVLSHHTHAVAAGEWHERFDESLERRPELLDFTRYAMQARPWIDAFGAHNLRLVRMEDFTADRPSTVESLARFIGVEPRPDLVETARVFNRSERKPVIRGPWRLVAGNPLYVRLVRPLLSAEVREKVRHAVLPRARNRRATIDERTVRLIYDRLAPDLEQLRQMMGRPEPVWALEDAIRRHGLPPDAADA